MTEKKYDIESDFEEGTKVTDGEQGAVVVDFSKEKSDVTGDLDEDPEIQWGDAGDEDEETVLSRGDEDEEEEPDETKSSGEEETEDVTDTDEDSGYSKSVRKRIARERAVTARERSRANRLEGRLERIERKLVQQTGDTEFATLKAETEDKLTDLKRRKKAAIEDGETDTLIDIDDEISNLKVELKAKELLRTKVDEVRDSESTDLPAKAQDWIDLHPEYESDPKFRRAVLGADRIVQSQGYNVNSDEYYAEISKILVERFPDYFEDDDLGGKRKPKQRVRRKSPVSGVTRGGNTVNSKANLKRGRVTLTAKDRRTMLTFGLDPTSKDDLAAFAKERLATLRAEAQEG